MKINPLLPPGIVGKYDAVQKKSGVAVPAGTLKDEVQLSGAAQSFAAAVKAAKAQVLESGAGADRIEELRKGIANGTYSVDAKDVADKMLLSF